VTVNPSPRDRHQYHHGSLREALLGSASRILERDGIAGLTLRSAAREAGVSHAAPKNHFRDLRGLLSELAAAGYERLGNQIRAAAAANQSPEAKLHAVGAAYVRFAMSHPGLFQLMFRGERLDLQRPVLRAAADELLTLLAEAVSADRGPGMGLGVSDALQMAKAWSQVHGLATLMIDGRMVPILRWLQPSLSEAEFLSLLLAVPDVQG
jgi:AcrR family transcriptional regulator